MKMCRITLVVCFSVLMISACTTQKALKETKRQFDNGEYGWAVYTGTIGVTMAALVDVFTLGGTAEPETGMQTVSAIANGNSASSTQHLSNIASSGSPNDLQTSSAQNSEECDRSTVEGFKHCCLSRRHGSLSVFTHAQETEDDGNIDYVCTGPAPHYDKEACTYSGTTLINGPTACRVQ